MTQTFDHNVQQLQRQFMESLPQKAHQLEDLWHHLRYLRWSDMGFKTFQQLAHRLAGSGASFGMPEVSQAAQLLDQYLLDYEALGQPMGGIEFEMIDQMVKDLSRTLANSITPDSVSDISTLKIAPPSIAPPTNAGAGKHIFLIEADHALSALMIVYLRHAGFSVHYFDSTTACIQHLSIQVPHAVLIDPTLMKDNGIDFEAIQQIKAQVTQDVPILFLSARTDMHTRLRALRAGCAAYITKPIDFTLLVNSLMHSIKTSEITHKVMIVDDEELVAEYHANILRHAGMEVICVSKPMQSLQRAAEFKPDLVVLDMHMPDITGIELARLLRQHEDLLLLPIVFLSSDISLRLRQSLESIGVNAVLTKPVAMGALVNACERAISDTFALKQRIETITQHAQHKQQITRSYFFAAIDNELQGDRSHQTPTALYYLGLDLPESFYREFGPTGTATLHEQFCARLAHIIGSEEQWSDIGNFVAGVLVGKRSRAQHQQRASQIAEQMSGHLYRLNDEVLVINTHVGVHYLDGELGTANTAIAGAEQAYALAKGEVSAAPHSLSSGASDADTIAAALAELSLSDTLPEDNLRICYQPMLNLESTHIEHFEALVRWRSKDDELIPAAKFLHHIEHSNLRIALDRWVLQSAVTMITSDNHARENASLFIHLSDETLAQKSFFSFAANVLRSSRLRGQRRLIFIFQEAWVASHILAAAATINALHNIECGACLSHAGSTEASADIMANIHFNYVRLAPALTAQPTNDPSAQARLCALVAAAKASGAEVIATQVEDSKNLAALWQQGIRLFQGFLLQSPDPTIHSYKDLETLKQLFAPNP